MSRMSAVLPSLALPVGMRRAALAFALLMLPLAVQTWQAAPLTDVVGSGPGWLVCMGCIAAGTIVVLSGGGAVLAALSSPTSVAGASACVYACIQAAT